MSYRGNRDILERDAEEIVRRILAGEATVSKVCAEYHVAYATLQKVYNPRTTPEQREAVRRRNLLRGNKANRFETGHTPWNKGLKGWCPAGAEKGWFRKGIIRGQAARNYRCIGTISVRRDHRKASKPRRWIKISDVGRPQDRWITLARFNWERAHGTIPKRMSVMHRDGDTLKDSLDNLVLVARSSQIAFQQKLNPKMLEKARSRAGMAARRRHARNRRIPKVERPPPDRWDCAACAAGIESDQPPDRCVKCGASAFEPRPQRATA